MQGRADRAQQFRFGHADAVVVADGRGQRFHHTVRVDPVEAAIERLVVRLLGPEHDGEADGQEARDNVGQQHGGAGGGDAHAGTEEQARTFAAVVQGA